MSPNWIRGLFSPTPTRRRMRPAAPPAGLRVEPLEDRVVPTTIFLDFGFNFPDGGLHVTNELSHSLNGPQVFDSGDGNRLISLTQTIEDEGMDLNGDGTADVADATIFADRVVESVRRIYEPFDVDIVQASASSFTDISDSLAANGEGPGGRDAYIIVAGNPWESLPAFGWATLDNGNQEDNLAFAFADEIISWPDLNVNHHGVARVAGHEAAHTFGLNHILGGLYPGEMMDVIDQNYLIQPLAMRFPSRGYVSYDLLADPDAVGLRADAPAYVTGTGIDDTITLAPGGPGQASIVVEAVEWFDQFTRTESYVVSTEHGLLVEAGFDNDLIIYDAAVGADLEVRGGENRALTIIDEGRLPGDTLRILNGTPDYTPAASGDPTEGTLSVNGLTVTFSEMEFVEGVAPEIVSLSPSSSLVNEGETLTLTGAFTDPGGLSRHRLTIDWGDGTSETIDLPAGARSFTRTHTYEGGNPLQGSFPITATITDNEGFTGSSGLEIRVNYRPTAADDVGVTPQYLPVTVPVLANDSDPEGQPLSVTAVSDPANGAVVTNPDGSITYTPEGGFTGTDTFTYTVTDPRGLSATATVSIEVLSPAQQIEVLRGLVVALRDEGALNGGQANALLQKLDHAEAKVEAGKTHVAVNLIGAFINQVESLRDEGVLTAEQAESLLTPAGLLLQSLLLGGA